MSKLTPLRDLPDLTEALVNALDHLYPEKCPSITDDERFIWCYAGKRELVRQLRTVLDQQNKHLR